MKGRFHRRHSNRLRRYDCWRRQTSCSSRFRAAYQYLPLLVCARKVADCNLRENYKYWDICNKRMGISSAEATTKHSWIFLHQANDDNRNVFVCPRIKHAFSRYSMHKGLHYLYIHLKHTLSNLTKSKCCVFILTYGKHDCVSAKSYIKYRSFF